ncbi:hypothetical protein JK231_22905 [Pantoea sp. JGM49]|uniref:hypothetical protein n=1 Tax=Pantoea sp. JGM49 TaxID=2799791 RepID=UPI001BA4F112|nr:hypothetical protein [Pantoea sp. JGM49]MBS0883444.1 hypothetical protein [Pantoea sp. JGM49]
MKVRYDEIQQEFKEISLMMVNSKEEIPSLLLGGKFIFIPALIYFIFFLICPFFGWFDNNLWQGAGIFSLAFWFFISVFLYSYSMIFSMLPKHAFKKFIILGILTKKVRVYYFLWIASIIVAGLLSIFTVYNILILSIATLISTVVLGLIFNLDISRYQIAGLFGAISAAKEKVM